MKDLGEANYILGIKIHRNRSKLELLLSQENYLKSVLKKYKMEESKLIGSPMDPSLEIYKDMFPTNDKDKLEMENPPYREII